MRKQVLIPSDDLDFVANFAEGYRRLGFDVSAGRINFDLECRKYDILHLLWPEELTKWQRPTSEQIDQTLARLDRWAKRSKIIISVNNLFPHGYDKDPAFHRLYVAFYERADVIHHFSVASKEAVFREFPSTVLYNHVVHIGFNYERLLPKVKVDRAAARRSFGFAPEDMVFLAFGALRFWEEASVLMKAFSSANVPRKKLLLASRYSGYGASWRQRLRRWRWRAWSKTDGVTAISDRVADEQIPSLFAAADAIIVVRQNSISSGVPSLAMTLGRFLIAPDFGAIAEYLDGTDNIVYDGFSAPDLAKAMERAFTIDRERIGDQNAVIAARWGWEDIVRTCVDALSSQESPLRERYSASGDPNLQ